MAKPKRQRFLLPGEDAPIAGLSLPLLPATGIYFLPEGEVKKVIVLFHGMTTNSRIMMAKALSELREAEPHAAIYALDAPFAADPARYSRAAHRPGRSNCRLWFEPPKERLYPFGKVVPQMRASVNRCQRLLEHIRTKHNLDNSSIHFYAFSQGCAAAFQTAMEEKDPIASMALLAGFILHPQIFGTANPQTNIPVFYASIAKDEVVHQGLGWHTTTVLRELDIPTVYHVTRACVQSLNGVKYTSPSQIMYERNLVQSPDPEGYPVSPLVFKVKVPWSDQPAERLYTRTRFADDGFGRLIYVGTEQEVNPTAHWVNPLIQKALMQWHFGGIVDETLGARFLKTVKTPKFGIRKVVTGWALGREIPKVQQPKVKPLWRRPHEAFARRRDRLTHQVSSFFNELGRWLAHSKVLQPILFFVPESMSERGPDTVHSKGRPQPAPHHIPYIGQDRRKKKLDLSNLPPERQAAIKAARAHFESLTRYPDGKPPRNTSEQPKPPPNPRRGGNLPPALDVSLTNQAPNRGEEVRSSLWLREQLRRIAQRWSSTPIIGR